MRAHAGLRRERIRELRKLIAGELGGDLSERAPATEPRLGGQHQVKEPTEPSGTRRDS
jgi:hypothetical protein